MRSADGQTGHETPLDRVAKSLSSEVARTELYRYATTVAEPMPPESTTWYVVGAQIQVNAVTRTELETLAQETKRGGTILAGLHQVAKRLPNIIGFSTLAAAIAIVCTLAIGTYVWHGAYGAGWSARDVVPDVPANQQVCRALKNVHQQLGREHRQSAAEALQRAMTQRGC